MVSYRLIGAVGLSRLYESLILIESSRLMRR